MSVGDLQLSNQIQITKREYSRLLKNRADSRKRCFR